MTGVTHIPDTGRMKNRSREKRQVHRWALANRQRAEELMDDPTMDDRLHVGALRGLARVNRLSRTAASIWAAMWRIERECNERPLRVLDLACGGGDITRRLAALALRDGRPFEFDGCDRSERAVDYAQRQSGDSMPSCRFFVRDVLDGSLPDGYDYFVSSLFLHHLADEQAVGLFREMARACGRGFLVHDLERSSRGFLLAAAATRAVTRSPIVRTDSLLSVRAAFSFEEIKDIPIRAGLEDARCARLWPRRLLLTWTMPRVHDD